MRDVVLVVECVSCKKTKELKASGLYDDLEFCDDCFMPMLAKKARTIDTTSDAEDN